MDEVIYSSLDLDNGIILNAEHIEHIEKGIIAAIGAINSINNKIGTITISPIDDEELKDILVV